MDVQLFMRNFETAKDLYLKAGPFDTDEERTTLFQFAGLTAFRAQKATEELFKKYTESMKQYYIQEMCRLTGKPSPFKETIKHPGEIKIQSFFQC